MTDTNPDEVLRKEFDAAVRALAVVAQVVMLERAIDYAMPSSMTPVAVRDKMRRALQPEQAGGEDDGRN